MYRVFKNTKREEPSHLLRQLSLEFYKTKILYFFQPPHLRTHFPSICHCLKLFFSTIIVTQTHLLLFHRRPYKHFHLSFMTKVAILYRVMHHSSLNSPFPVTSYMNTIIHSILLLSITFWLIYFDHPPSSFAMVLLRSSNFKVVLNSFITYDTENLTPRKSLY